MSVWTLACSESTFVAEKGKEKPAAAEQIAESANGNGAGGDQDGIHQAEHMEGENADDNEELSGSSVPQDQSYTGRGEINVPNSTIPFSGEGEFSDDPSNGGQGDFFSCGSTDSVQYPIFVLVYKIPDSVVQEVPKREDYPADDAGGLAHAEAVANHKLLTMHMMTGAKILTETDPFAYFCMAKYDVAPREFRNGFPRDDGTGNVIKEDEWFAFDARVKIVITEAGSYKFRMRADDGVRMWIKKEGTNEFGNPVVDFDGLHHPSLSDVGEIELPVGEHLSVVHYFQGPRMHIALQLEWKKPGATDWEIVPTSHLKYNQ